MKKGPKKPAYAYLRRSNAEESASEKRQREAIKKAAGAAGYRIVEDGYFFDASISGSLDVDGRPALTKLFALLEKGEITTVFCEGIDRIARSVLCGQVLCEQFKTMGVSVYDSWGKNLTTCADKESELIRNIMLCIADYEKSKIVARMLDGRRRKRDNLKAASRKNNRISTKVEGRKAYGFHPDEKDILKRIKQLRTKGGNKERTWGGIANALNDAGLKNRSGNDWKMANVRSIGLANGLC
jgi:DNA invertase Pin-like site-specific DNA recombinase